MRIYFGNSEGDQLTLVVYNSDWGQPNGICNY